MGIDEWLAEQEATVPSLRPACAKTILLASEKGVQTDISVVFIHGLSAAYHEIRLLPDLVAKALGANLYFACLTRHGQDSAAMGAATFDEWRADVHKRLMW